MLFESIVIVPTGLADPRGNVRSHQEILGGVYLTLCVWHTIIAAVRMKLKGGPCNSDAAVEPALQASEE